MQVKLNKEINCLDINAREAVLENREDGQHYFKRFEKSSPAYIPGVMGWPKPKAFSLVEDFREYHG